MLIAGKREAQALMRVREGGGGVGGGENDASGTKRGVGSWAVTVYLSDLLSLQKGTGDQT